MTFWLMKIGLKQDFMPSAVLVVAPDNRQPTRWTTQSANRVENAEYWTVFQSPL